MKKSNGCFQNIVGQTKIVAALTQAIKNKRISHSYIFSGPQGSQRTEMAYSFAKALLSEEGSYESSARRVEDGNHPDLIDIFPEGKSIKIKQIRDHVIKDISIKPYESKYKIYIIHQAETLGLAAQNALLKTLEEPPEYGVVILMSDNISTLLATIISRSQNLQFQLLNQTVIQRYLQENYHLEKQKARRISVLANGSIERAILLCQEKDLFPDRQELLKNLLKIIKHKDLIEIFSTAKYLLEEKDQLDENLDFMMLWFRDVYLYKELGNNRWIIHKEYADLLEEFAYYLSEQQISAIIEEVNLSKNNRKYNVNLQLNMETMLLKMQEE